MRNFDLPPELFADDSCAKPCQQSATWHRPTRPRPFRLSPVWPNSANEWRDPTATTIPTSPSPPGASSLGIGSLTGRGARSPWQLQHPEQTRTYFQYQLASFRVQGLRDKISFAAESETPLQGSLFTRRWQLPVFVTTCKSRAFVPQRTH